MEEHNYLKELINDFRKIDSYAMPLLVVTVGLLLLISVDWRVALGFFIVQIGRNMQPKKYEEVE